MDQGECPGASPDLHACLPQPLSHGRKKFTADLFMDKHGFHGIAYTGPLHLCVKTDIGCHVEIRKFIHIHMAHTLIVL